MINLSFLLLGISLVLVSIVAITYSSSDLRNTSAKRNKFFKGIRMFMFLYLIPVFTTILLVNLRHILLRDYITLENSAVPAIYILSAIANLVVTFIFVWREVNKGIELFRRSNRDNTKYNRALMKSRNGLILMLILIGLTLFIIIR